MKRATAVVLLALMTSVVALASPAHAAPAQSVDYGGVCTISVTPPNPAPGATATVTGQNFPANTSQPIILSSTPVQIGTANIGADGTFSTVVTIPADLAPGAHTISVLCVPSGVSATVNFSVPGASTETTTVSTGGVAVTGSDSEPKVVIAFAAIAVGVALVMAARRRRHRLVA
jgi:hypothetical protein